MELAHSLTFNENAHKSMPTSTRDLFLFEWLKFLGKVLPGLDKKELKQCQERLEKQLLALISVPQSCAIQKSLGEIVAVLFNVGETFGLYAFIESCNERLRVKDDTTNNVKIKICVINVFFGMYATLGRMMGNTFADTIQMLLRNTKSNDSDLRSCSLQCLGTIMSSLGAMCTSYHRDVYKTAKSFNSDRSMSVRISSMKLLESLIPNAATVVTSDLDNLVSVCCKALENGNYDVRLAVSSVLSKLLVSMMPASKAVSLNTLSNAPAPKQMAGNQAGKKLSTDECFGVLASCFFKSSSAATRVGIVESYIAFFDELGKHWVEKHVKFIINHTLSLLDNPKMLSSHIEAVYCRRSVNFILSHVINQVISEKSQNEAAKELIKLLAGRMQQVSIEATDQVVTINQHVIICTLNQISSLVSLLGSSISVFFTEHVTGAVNTVVGSLLYPATSVSLAAAWCLRCIVIAVPAQLTVLIDTTQEKIEASKNNPESLVGYSNALTAILGAVPLAELGVPSIKAKNAFSIAEDLLRTASQNSRMSLARTQCGWMIIGALMNLGAITVRHFLSKLLLLWRNAFPRSAKEIETEKSKFDQFNWQVALEGRAGALCAMESFLQNCSELVSDDVTRRMLVPLECALTMLANLPINVKASAAQTLKVSGAFFRLRLFLVLGQLPSECYESFTNQLIRVLINEFALTDKQSAITTSYLEQVGHKYNSILLGANGTDSDHQEIEEQMLPVNHAISCGTLEHDPVSIYAAKKFQKYRFSPPGPLPLGIAVVDASVSLFSKIFCATAVKHRIKIMQHFVECLKQTKSVKHHSVQINILTVLLSCLKTMAENKTPMGSNELQELILTLLLSLLGDQSDVIRCAAAECVGRLAQVVADNTFTARISQSCFDKIQLQRDPTIRMGNALTLGFVHRYVGGIGAGQHLSTSISICLALAQDMSNTSVQVWALHSLALITDSGGVMIRSYVEHILALMINLLMTVPISAKDIHRYIGKCVVSLITILGPELQGNAPQISSIRSSCQLASDFLLGSANLPVIAEGISCYQQLHLFTPKHAALNSLVNFLCKNLSSSCLVLRQVSCSCLKQLSQRQADQVSQLAAAYFAETRDATNAVDSYSSELELEAALFTLLDRETDLTMQTNVKDTIVMILNSQAILKLQAWLTLLRNVLFIATGEEAAEQEPKGGEEEEDDDTTFQPVNKDTSTTLHQRCNTRVFAVQCVQKIFGLAAVGTNDGVKVESNKTSYQSPDGSLFSEVMLNQEAGTDPLITHIQELVRIGFMAATASYDQLQIEGLKVLEELIKRFCHARDPDFDDQPLLEQYQAQFGAALRPAFLRESSPHVLSKACNLCSIWITSGIATDIVDLRRIHQLLVTSLSKAQNARSSGAHSVFSECSATSERLAVLKAWADMYYVAIGMEQSSQTDQNQSDSATAGGGGGSGNNNTMTSSSSSLLELVTPELSNLYIMWIEALKEYGLALSNGNVVVNDEVPLSIREPSWGNLLCSATLYFTTHVLPKAVQDCKIVKRESDGRTYFLDNEILSDIHLLMGLSSVPLSQPTMLQNPLKITFCLKSLVKLVEQPQISNYMSEDDRADKIVELAQILFKVVLSCGEIEVLDLLVQSTRVLSKCAVTSENLASKCDLQDSSLVKVLLEILSCVFSRHVPSLRETLTVSNIRPVKKFKEQSAKLISSSCEIFPNLLKLVDNKFDIAVRTTCLHMLVCALKDSCLSSSSAGALSSVLHCIKTLTAHEVGALSSDESSEEPKNDDSSKDANKTENDANDTKLEMRQKMWTKVLTSVYLSVLDFAENSEECDISRCVLTFATLTLAFPEKITVNSVILERSVAFLSPVLRSERSVSKLQHLKVISSLLRANKKVVALKFCKPILSAIFEELSKVTEENPDIWQCLKEEVDILLLGLPLVLEITGNNSMLYHFIKVLVKIMDVYSNQSQLYLYSIETLKRLSAVYSEQIKAIFAQDAQLKEDVSNAVKRTIPIDMAKDTKGSKSQDAGQKAKQPSIQLKIDFSNFGK